MDIGSIRVAKGISVFAAAAGFLFGVSLSYLIIIPGWINETQSFLDLVQRRKSLDKDKEELLKSISTNLNK